MLARVVIHTNQKAAVFIAAIQLFAIIAQRAAKTIISAKNAEGLIIRLVTHSTQKPEEMLKRTRESQKGLIKMIKANVLSCNQCDIFREGGFETNKIYNTDCVSFMKNIEDDKIDLIFADPPYNLSGSRFNIKFVQSGGSDLNTDKGEWDQFESLDQYEEFTKTWLSECFRILKEDGSIFVAGTYHNIYVVGYIMQKLGLTLLNEILWHKTDATPNISCTRFVADHENFVWARKGKKHKFNYQQLKSMNGGTQMRSIWSKGKTAGGKKIHPTQKPEWLLDRIITAASNKGDIVFDPFIGSGTTAVVAKQLSRIYLGTELNKDYYKVAQRRLNSILL